MFSQFYVGKVTDNKDPDEIGRIKVSKQDEEETASDWIPYITPYAGTDYGLFFLPDVDDEVLIVSLDAQNIRKVAIGALWNTNAKPPQSGENGDADLNQDGKNNLHFIKSRAGSMLIFDDTDGKEKIQIIASDDSSRIEFSVSDKLVNVKTKNDIAIGAKGKVSIKAETIEVSGKKQINFSGDEIQISAKKNLAVNADQDITIKGSGIALN